MTARHPAAPDTHASIRAPAPCVEGPGDAEQVPAHRVENIFLASPLHEIAARMSSR